MHDMPPMKKPVKVFVDPSFLSRLRQYTTLTAQLLTQAYAAARAAKRDRADIELARQLAVPLKGKHPFHGTVIVAPFK
jgi:hypothetical protein